MLLFDSHCHIDDKSYDKDLPLVLERAREAGVCANMIVGITLKTCRKAIEICRTHDNCFASVGVHPHDAKSCSEEVLKELAAMAENSCVRAWGETGLDFNRMFSPQDVQEKWFARQLEMAGETGLPVIIHERDTNGRLQEVLKSSKPDAVTGVVHCFSGTRDEMFAYLDMGLYIGVTGVVTHKARGKGLRALVPQIPEDRLLVETDAPYLTPSPLRNRHRRNEPAFVRAVLEKIAEIKGADPDALSEKIFKNTCRLYNIDKGELL